MNPIGMVVDLIANLLRFLRNLLVSIGPGPDFAVLTVRGTLPERRAARRPLVSRLLPSPLAPGADESLEEWRERLRDLAQDRRLRGAVLKIADLRAGAATLESLRKAFERFRGSGKRLVAYLATADLSGYYLASVADTIVAPESGELSLHGPRTELTFLRVALDRLGILPQFHHIAEYKTAAHRFLYPQMTDAQRETAGDLLDGLYGEITSSIARSRGLEEAAVRDAIDRGILTAGEAKTRRLIDVVGFEDELPRLLSVDGRPARIVPWELVQARIRRPYRWSHLQRRAIGVVQLIGAIVPGESRDLPVPVPIFGAHFAGHETVARAFRAAERSPGVAAIVFHVDSGGGSAVASDLIWREVMRVQQRKPVVVYMGNVAGSGGYYVGCGVKHIVAGATTITGSIGVVSGKFSLRDLFARTGLRREILTRGATAAMFSAFTAFTEQEWGTLRRWMEDVYVRFKTKVADGRGEPVERIESLARGHVYTGRQALALRLIDEIGDFETAVRKAKSLAGIPEDADVPVVTVRPPKTAAVPQAPVAAWVDGFRQTTQLLQEPALLLI